MRFVLLPVALFASITLLGACSSDDTDGKSTGNTNQGIANPKFETDVLPILVKNCALSACHASKEAPAGVHITADKDATHEALLKPSTRFVGTRIVVPGEPSESLLMRKMDNTQDELANCPEKDGKPDCGRSMPPPEESDSQGATGDEELLSRKSRDTIRNWIRNGAKKD